MKIILSAVIAACGANHQAANPGDPVAHSLTLVSAREVKATVPKERPDKRPRVVRGEHYFCCADIPVHGKASAIGCEEIPASQVDRCDTVLYCDDGYMRNGETVTCVR